MNQNDIAFSSSSPLKFCQELFSSTAVLSGSCLVQNRWMRSWVGYGILEHASTCIYLINPPTKKVPPNLLYKHATYKRTVQAQYKPLWILIYKMLATERKLANFNWRLCFTRGSEDFRRHLPKYHLCNVLTGLSTACWMYSGNCSVILLRVLRKVFSHVMFKKCSLITQCTYFLLYLSSRQCFSPTSYKLPATERHVGTYLLRHVLIWLHHGVWLQKC